MKDLKNFLVAAASTALTIYSLCNLGHIGQMYPIYLFANVIMWTWFQSLTKEEEV